MRKLFLILSLFLLTTSIYAQEDVKNIPFTWDDFSKGLNTQLSPYSLPKEQALIAENCRYNLELKSLSKRKPILLYGTADSTETILGGHRLYLKAGTKILLVDHGDDIDKGTDSTGAFTKLLTVGSGDYRWQWLTWNDRAIGTDGYNYPVKTDGTNISYIGSCAVADAGSGAGPDGTYTYKISFYTNSYEVAFNVASPSVTVSDNDISLSMIPIGPTTYGGESVTGRKVYRIKNGGSTYYLLSNGTIANNTTTTLTDTDTDGELSGTTYSTTYTCTPPKGRIPLINKNRLMLFNNPSYPSRWYYSDDGNMDYFVPTDYYIDVRPDDGDQITLAQNWLGNLWIGKENSIQKGSTEGDTPSTDWGYSDPYTKIGCAAMYSVDVTPLGIFYLNFSGLYKFNGQYSTLVSEAVTPTIKDISESNFANCWGKYHKNIYYLAYPSKATGSSSNNRVLGLDLLSNGYFIDKLNINCFFTFNSGSDWDVLYGGSSADGKVYSYSEANYELIHNKHSDFGGTFTSCGYIPTGVAGGDSNDPVIEIRRTGIIDDMSGTINAQTGSIDRNLLAGTYVSDGLQVGATSYDKLYWNEKFYSSGDDITFAIRSASTEAGLTGAWSSEYTDPSGSDISALTANTWLQYRFQMTTDAYTHSPELYKSTGYVIRLTYKKEGSSTETTVPLHWQSGWTHLGYPGRRKILRYLYCIHDSPNKTGTLTVKFNLKDYNVVTKTYDDVSDTFDINLTTHPQFYTRDFANGIIGEWVQLDITNGITSNDLNDLDIKSVMVLVDVEPLT